MTEANPDPDRKALAECVAGMLAAQQSVETSQGASRRLAERALNVAVGRAFAAAEAVVAGEATALAVDLIAARREVARLELALIAVAGMTLLQPGERGRPLPLPPLVRQIAAEAWTPKPAPDPRVMRRWVSRWELHLRVLMADPTAKFDARLSPEDAAEARRQRREA